MNPGVPILLLFFINTIRWYRAFLDTIRYIYVCWKIVFDANVLGLHL